ncbi:MAG: SgcJ/EcaC family oxidoreductase [Candidatus Binatia bacterium]
MSQHSIPKSLLVSLGFLVAVGAAPAVAPSAFAFGLGGGTAADVKSQQAIRDLYGDFVKAWNKHDVETMAARWAIDGDQVEPDGQVAKGRDEVAALLKRQHTGVFKNTTLTLTVKSVWMISDNVALVDGTYELTGAQEPDGTAVPARKGMLTSVLIQERDTWSIAASRLMVPTVLPYKSKLPASPADAAAPKQP